MVVSNEDILTWFQFFGDDPSDACLSSIIQASISYWLMQLIKQGISNIPREHGRDGSPDQYIFSQYIVVVE